MKIKMLHILRRFSCSFVLGAVAAVAVGQDSETSSDDDDGVFELSPFTVSGIRNSLSEGINIKREKTEFVDALVAEDFADFPDSNLAEALQRIPGITVERNDGGSQSNAVGEAATINLRGLGPSFTRTEINGMTATNAGSDRGFGFNILASELFGSAFVSKSLSAKDNEGGLSGIVKLETHRPLDFQEETFSLSLRGTYGELSESFTPAATIFYANQADDGKFGYAVGINYDQTEPMEQMADVSNWDFLRDSMKGNFDLLTPEEQAAIADVLIPRDPRIMVNDRDQTRTNLSLSLEAKPSDNLTITFDNLYANVDHTGEQIRNDFPIEGFPATFVPADLVVDGDRFISGTFPAASHFMRLLAYDYDVQTQLYQGILSAEWQASDSLMVKPSFGYSTAEEDFVTWNSFDLRSAATDIFYEVDGAFTTFTPAIGSPSDPSLYTVLSRIRNRPDIDEDEELSGRVDFELEVNNGFVTYADFGVRWSDREKSFKAFDGRATLDGSITDLAPFIEMRDFGIEGAPANYPTRILTVDYDALQQAAAPSGFDVPEKLEARYDVSEETTAAYGMLNFNKNALSGNVGVRFVTTDQTSVGFERVTDVGGGRVLQAASFSNSYDYFLPSLNVKWDISEDVVGRLAVYRSLTRPQLTDIQPARNFDAFDGGNGTAGNPELDPFTATNIDLGFEWYFADDAIFSFNLFRKDLNGLIERIVEETQVTDSVTGQQYTINLSRPINGESAEIEGLEIGIQSPFSFLPEQFHNAGFVLNATFTDSEAVFRNTSDLRSSSLPGLSDVSYNAILYYDAEPVTVRLAYNKRSDYLLTVSGSGGQPVSRDDYGQLDFSSSYAINDNVKLTFDVINLTDKQLRSFSTFDPLKVKGLVQTGRKLVIGANFKY